MTTTQREKFERFKELHEQKFAFSIPNPWDAGSAKILTDLGFSALATSSAGHAFSLGLKDGQAAISREKTLENAKAIVEATHLPVSADLENGFGESPEECARTIVMASEIGLVGGSIEDATGFSENPIIDFNLAVDRVAAAAEAAKDKNFFLTARSENFLHGKRDLDDTIKRLQAFEKAGADVVFAPALPSLEAIRLVCDSVNCPVNVVAGLSSPNFTMHELHNVGVKRISVGGSFARTALTGLINAAKEVRDFGTFSYAQDTLSHCKVSSYMD